MPLQFVKTGGLTAADYKDSLEITVSDPLLAALPDGDPLKVSKKLALGALPTKFTDWDVTPSVATDVATLAIVSNDHMTVSNTGALSVDYTGAPVFMGSQPVLWGGAVKTNIDLSKLTVGTAIHIGYEISSVAPTYAPFLLGFMLADPTATPTDVLNSLLAQFGQGTIPTITHANLSSMVTMYGVQKQTNISWVIPNDINPLFQGADGMLVLKNQPFISPLDLGSKVIMALGRESDRISVANINVAPNGTTYDVIDAAAITNNPVLPADTTLFYFIIGLDFGQGYPVISITPTITAAPPSYDVTGTTYGTAHAGTNGTWAGLFPNPITTPTSTVVTQATFPAGAAVGRGLRAMIDPGYTAGFPVAPYGHTVSHGTKCIVDSVTTGSEDFTPLLAMDDLVGINAALVASQTQLTTLTQAVAAAAKNSTMGEIVIYVRADPVQSQEIPIPSGPTVFDTFDLAYTYAVGLPKYLRKRIVLDDRVNVIFRGVEQAAVNNSSPTTFKLYALLANNITLSCYSVFTSSVVALPYNPRITLYFACDGLRLEDFSGYSGTLVDSLGGQQPMFDIFTGVISPNGVTSEENLIIGTNSVLVSTSADIGIEQGGTVVIDNDGHWMINAYAINQSQFGHSVIIAKARFGKLNIHGGVYPQAYDGNSAFTIIMEHSGIAPNTAGLSDPAAVYITYTDAAPRIPFTYGINYVVVESVNDLIRVGGFNGGSITELNISTQYMYFVVGDVDLGDVSINVYDNTNGKPIKFIGLPGSKLTSTGVVFQGIYPPPIYNPTLDITGVDIATTNPGIPAINVFGSLILKGSTVYSNKVIMARDILGYQAQHNVELRNVVFLSTGGGFIDAMGVIDVRGRVIIDGVFAKVNTGVQVLSIDIKPVTNPFGLEQMPNSLCTIDNVTVLYSEAVALRSCVFDLGKYKTGTAGYVGTYPPGQISVNNVSVQFVGSNNNGRYELFASGGNVYDHHTDESIRIEGSHSYAYVDGSGGYYIGLDPSAQVYAFLDPIMLREFEILGYPANTLKYNGKTSKVFELFVKYTVAANTASVGLTMDVRHNALNVNHGSVQTALGTANEPYSDGIVIPILLAPEDSVHLVFRTTVNCNLNFGNFRISLKEA